MFVADKYEVVVIGAGHAGLEAALAAARVHKLFIMVVSEDKSEFTFADRFEMVKRGTEKFPNVEVLPSGQFIISQKTFSGYFNKENLQDVQVDSSHINFCEIPRREIDGQVISAKSVRAALKVGDFDKLKKLVPTTTLDYLR